MCREQPYDLQEQVISRDANAVASSLQLTERDVELERQANHGAVSVEQLDRLPSRVDLRVRHEQRAVHLYGALLPEDSAKLVVNELSVRVVVRLGLSTAKVRGVTMRTSRYRETYPGSVIEIIREILPQTVLVGLSEECRNELLGVGRAGVGKQANRLFDRVVADSWREHVGREKILRRRSELRVVR